MNHRAIFRLQYVLFRFMNNLASHLERSHLIHSYGYESAGDRPTCLARLFVSSMRLTPSGLTRYFVPDKILFIKPNRTNCNRLKAIKLGVTSYDCSLSINLRPPSCNIRAGCWYGVCTQLPPLGSAGSLVAAGRAIMVIAMSRVSDNRIMAPRA